LYPYQNRPDRKTASLHPDPEEQEEPTKPRLLEPAAGSGTATDADGDAAAGSGDPDAAGAADRCDGTGTAEVVGTAAAAEGAADVAAEGGAARDGEATAAAGDAEAGAGDAGDAGAALDVGVHGGWSQPLPRVPAREGRLGISAGVDVSDSVCTELRKQGKKPPQLRFGGLFTHLRRRPRPPRTGV